MKFKYIIASASLLILAQIVGLGQKKVRTTGTAQIEWINTMSKVEAEQKAQDLATIDALEKAFGRVVVQGNATYISNVNSGEKVETNTTFNMIANTSVKGEVVEVLDVNYSEVKGYRTVNGKREEITDIKCEITVLAKEIVEIPVEFDAYTLSCDNINCKSTEFVDGSDFFMYFKSPVSGYLSIYLDMTGETLRILPYMEMPENYESGFPVKADNEYIFFSTAPEHNYKGEKEFYLVDELELTAEKEIDLNRIFVVFSTSPINKPKLKQENKNLDNRFLSEFEKDKGYKMPYSLRSEDFQDWLNKNRSYRKEEMQVSIIDISIRKN